MAIPDYQTLMRPVLEIAANNEIAAKEVIQQIAQQFDLSTEEIEQTIPSG
jgi:restriction system protein